MTDLTNILQNLAGRGSPDNGELVRSLERAKEDAPPPPAVGLQDAVTDMLSQDNPAAYSEVKRICSLPVVEGYSSEVREAFQREIILADQYEKGFRLRDVQCDSVLAFDQYGYLLAPIGVGHGKTLITLLCAAVSYAKGKRKILLVIPPNLMTQLVKRDIPWARQRVVLFGCPFIPLLGDAKRRRALATSGRLGCYIMPSSGFQARNAAEVLEGIAPDTLLIDEAHQFKNVGSSARAKRLMRVIEEFDPDLLWASGTITAKSVSDYAHMVKPFNEWSPLPRDHTRYDWAAVIDAAAEPGEKNLGPIRPLIDWAAKQAGAPDCPATAAGFRHAYRYRLITNPTVVATGDAELGVTLTINQQHVETENVKGIKELRELQAQLQFQWVAPTGDEIDHAFHMFRWHFELSAGIYNDLYWPSADMLAKRRAISSAEATQLLGASQEHHLWKQEYHKELRGFLQYRHIPGLDTPFLVGDEMYRNGARSVPQTLYDLWKKCKDLEAATPDMPERWKRVIRVCDYKVQHAVRWAAKMKHGIIWYKNKGVGLWLKELLPDALYCPASQASNELLADYDAIRDRILICSIGAHSIGKNLQYSHSNQLYVQWPREAIVAEQVLGRVHRHGQEADDVVASIAFDADWDKVEEFKEFFGDTGKGKNRAGSFDELNYAAMLRDALYIHQTTGTKQKVVIGNYDPLPRIFPPSVLEERGFELDGRLAPEDESLLAETFQPEG